MNTCKHCGFTGEAKDFVYRTGSVCKECRKAQKRVNYEKYYRENREEILGGKKYYRQVNLKRISENNKKHYQENHEEALEKARIKRRKKGILHWSQVKHFHLGLYIEQTIAAMFGVLTEAFGTPGVDFICSNGYKMQVKAASITYVDSKTPRWAFHINKNKIADYFILVAVNNAKDIDKEDFKPEHIWMMKGNLINKQSGVSTTLSKISKWDEYSIMEKYENRFIKCCTTIKESKLEDTTK